MVRGQKAQDLQIYTRLQLRNWKNLAQDAIATTTSIGIVIGGAAATAAGAATALAQGIMQGAKSATADRSQLSVEDSTVDARRPCSLANSIEDARRRANRLEDLGIVTVKEFCPKCEYGKGKHTYGQDCKGFPASVYFPRFNSECVILISAGTTDYVGSIAATKSTAPGTARGAT